MPFFIASKFAYIPNISCMPKVSPSHIVKPLTKYFIVRWESKLNKKFPLKFYLYFVCLWNVEPFLLKVWLLQCFAGHCGILNHINVWKNDDKTIDWKYIWISNLEKISFKSNKKTFVGMNWFQLSSDCWENNKCILFPDSISAHVWYGPMGRSCLEIQKVRFNLSRSSYVFRWVRLKCLK